MMIGLLHKRSGVLAGVAVGLLSTCLALPALADNTVFQEALNDVGYTVVASHAKVTNASKNAQSEYELSLRNEKGDAILEISRAQAGSLSGLMLADIDGDGTREIIVSMSTNTVEKLVHFVDIFQFNGQALTLVEHNLAKINPTTHEIWLF